MRSRPVVFVVRPLRVALGLCLLLPIAQTARAHDQVPCAEALTAAENLYFYAEFEQAIALLQRCLGENAFSDAQQTQAYVQLAKAFLAN